MRFNKNYAKFVARDPMYWIELIFRIIGIVFMAVGIFSRPLNYFYFFIGVANYGFSLLLRKKRLEIYRKMIKGHQYSK